ncbi:MAG: DUF433 domain-containing protein [Planctomycetaceae bacterium]|nr:DUF433 domain-containing protein [Planctomycetaceae bacterium]
MTTIAVGQVEVDHRGVAYVGPARMKVSHIVRARTSWGLSPEEIAEAYDSVTLSDVFTALAYYASHQAAVDAQITTEDARTDELRAQTGNPALQARLRRLADEKSGTP